MAYDIMFGTRSTFDPDRDIPSLEGKVIIVTGGEHFLGYDFLPDILIYPRQ